MTKSSKKKNNKHRGKASTVASTVVVPGQSLDTVPSTPSEFDPSYDVVADVFGKSVSQKLKTNTTHARKNSLMKQLGVTDENINMPPPSASETDNLSQESMLSFLPLGPTESSIFSLDVERPKPPPKTVGLAVDQNNRVYEIELREVNHPTYNPPLGSYEFYKVYDHYMELLEEFKKRERNAQYEGLVHIWQQKLKAELLRRYRWPPKIMSDTFWSYGYYRDYFPLETRVNLDISKTLRKSLEDILFGAQSQQQQHIRAYRHRLNSGFNFESMRTKLEQKALEPDDNWFLRHPDIHKSEEKLEEQKHKHHHRAAKDTKIEVPKSTDKKGEIENDWLWKDKEEKRGRRYTGDSAISTNKGTTKSATSKKIKKGMNISDVPEEGDSELFKEDYTGPLKKAKSGAKSVKSKSRKSKNRQNITDSLTTDSMTTTTMAESSDALFDEEDAAHLKSKKSAKSVKSKSQARKSKNRENITDTDGFTSEMDMAESSDAFFRKENDAAHLKSKKSAKSVKSKSKARKSKNITDTTDDFTSEIDMAESSDAAQLKSKKSTKNVKSRKSKIREQISDESTSTPTGESAINVHVKGKKNKHHE